MAKLNRFNDRLVQMDLADEENYEFLYDPDFTLVKPSTNILGKINSQTQQKLPPNIPEAQLNPEKWEFYDKDTKITRPNTEVGGRFVGRTLDNPGKFLLYQQEKDALKEYLQLEKRIPDIGYYDPMYDLIESGVIGIPNFSRYLERSVLPSKEELMQQEIEGDNLVFSRELKKPRVKVLVDMDKYTGRHDQEDDAKFIGYEDLEVSLLLAEEMRKLVDKRVKVLVDMKKETGRKDPVEEVEGIDENLDQKNVYDLNRKWTEKKVNVLVNIDKHAGRKDLENLEKLKNKNEDLDFEGNDAIVDINLGQVKPKVKTLVAYRQPSKKIGGGAGLENSTKPFKRKSDPKYTESG